MLAKRTAQQEARLELARIIGGSLLIALTVAAIATVAFGPSERRPR